MFRLTSFLKRAPAITRSAFVSTWRDRFSVELLAHPALAGRLRRYVINLPIDPVPPEHAWIANDEFDGVAELWFSTLDDAVEASNAIAADSRLIEIADSFVDPTGCISWIGAFAEDFDSPRVTIKRIVAGQKAPHLTLEDAQAYWLVGHNAFMKGFPEFMAYMLRYATVAGIPTPDLKLRSYRLFAMCADVGFASLQDLDDAYREPRMAAAGAGDLAKFGADSGAILFTAAREEILYSAEVERAGAL